MQMRRLRAGDVSPVTGNIIHPKILLPLTDNSTAPGILWHAPKFPQYRLSKYWAHIAQKSVMCIACSGFSDGRFQGGFEWLLPFLTRALVNKPQMLPLPNR